MSGEAAHTHAHDHDHGHSDAPAPGSMLTTTEQRSAARQLTLAMLALGLLALGLVWRFLRPNKSASANCCSAPPPCW
jgi:Cd2+/Zn2+-exporting ATPase